MITITIYWNNDLAQHSSATKTLEMKILLKTSEPISVPNATV